MKALSSKVAALAFLSITLVVLASWVAPTSFAQIAPAGSDPLPPPPDASATRLIEAVRTGDGPLFARILSEQPEVVNRRAASGSTPLMYAALYADANAVAMLLDRGADPNLANEAGATALMCAIGDEQITRRLLDRGADANATSQQGHTPLSIAAGRAGSRKVVELLLDYGASASPASRALVQAANAGDAEVFRLLVERGADVKAAGPFGLMLAARSNCATCVDMLIESVTQANLNVALLGLAPFGDTSLLTRLIDRGADVNASLANVRPDLRNRTPLMLAASSDFVPIDTVKMLIARGADIDALGPEGETALDLARRNGDTAVVTLLQKAGAKAGRGFPTARVTPKPATSARAAIERVMPLLQTSGVTFVEKAGCVSCHNNTLTTMTVAAAREHGLPFDEVVAGKQRKAIASVVESRHHLSLLGADQSNTANSALMGLAADNRAPDLVTDAMAYFLKGRQLADGRWRDLLVDHRPPLQGSDIEVTAASIRALRLYAPKPQRAEYEMAVQRGVTWLLTMEPKTTDQRVLQLLGLTWGGVEAGHERVQAAVRALLAEQRGDGGWGQLPTLASDAYATGQALVALKNAGTPRVIEAAYQRGVRFLLSTQLADGSWYVKTRSLPFQPYFESGFPHGPDQWISIAASNWAATALALASPVRKAAR